MPFSMKNISAILATIVPIMTGEMGPVIVKKSAAIIATAMLPESLPEPRIILTPAIAIMKGTTLAPNVHATAWASVLSEAPTNNAMPRNIRAAAMSAAIPPHFAARFALERSD